MCHPALDAFDSVEESIEEQDDKCTFTDVAFLAIISCDGRKGAHGHSNSATKTGDRGAWLGNGMDYTLTLTPLD
jgi:hypothetical protein